MAVNHGRQLCSSGGPMAGTASRPPVAGEVTMLTVHGPRGALDLTVSTGTTLAEVSQTYAREARLPAPLPLVTATGERLRPLTLVGDAGLEPGSVLVAVDDADPVEPVPAAPETESPSSALTPGPATGTWLAVACALAAVAGWSATRLEYDDRWPAVVVLLLAAAAGCLPFGALAAQRVLAAPAFAAAACLALVWDPAPERLPTVLGAAALAAAVTAALGRALAEPGSGAEEGLRAWIVTGVCWFAVAALGALAGADPQVVWAILFLLAVLAARFVPEVAVDVDDQHLLDVERLAVTAWSAREWPAGERGGALVPADAVGELAARGARTVGAAALAILVVAGVSAPLLLWSADLPLDRIGARCLVGFGGAVLLLAARSYRHRLPRRALLLGGVVSLVALAVVLLDVVADDRPGLVALVATASVLLGGILVLVAVLVGRGWRSAWWARRAEIAEAVCGSAAVASLVVAAGLFRHLWKVAS